MFGRTKSTDVLVVGAGPVGLFAALQLARRGVGVEIIDSQWRTAARSYALALHPSTVELLGELRVAESLVSDGRSVERIALCDRDGIQASASFERVRGRFPFALVMPQSLFEAQLEKLLASEGVDVKWNHRLSGLRIEGERAAATVDRLAKESTGYSVTSTEWVVDKTSTFDARFVFGADGHGSAVRRLADIGIEGAGGAQQYAVFECSTDRDSGSEMRVVLEESGRASVYWPLPGMRFRWSFGLDHVVLPAGRDKQRLAVQVGERTLPYLSPGGLNGLLEERAPWFDQQVEDIHWSVAVRFEQCLASEFGRGPVLLLGDAAHTTGPVGVRSMNAGLAEAAELAERVEEIIRRGGSRSDLASYDSKRMAAWRGFAGVEGAATAAEDAPEWIRLRAGSIPGCIPASGEDLERVLESLGLQVPARGGDG